MSADNWAVCPRCLMRAKAEEGRQLAEVMRRYGKIPVAEFDAARSAIQPVDPHKLTTFREDYVISGAEAGVITVSYSGHCQTCGFGTDFKDEHPLPGWDAP